MARHFASICLLLCAACRSADAEPASNDDDLTQRAPEPVCAKQTTKDGVVVCTETFATAPFVKTPAVPKLEGHVTVRAAIRTGNYAENPIVATLADGTDLLIADDKGRAVDAGRPNAVFAGVGFPTYRSIATLYDLEGDVGGAIENPLDVKKSLRVTVAKPAVTLDGCALASVLVGTWEGTVSTRLPAPMGHPPFLTLFDEEKTVKIHVTVSKLEAFGKFTDWTGKPTDIDNFRLHAVIDNAMAEAKDGATTYPALRDLPGGGPFDGATSGDVVLVRLGSMHGIGADGHWVLDYPQGSKDLTTNGMSQEMPGIFGASAGWFMQNAGVRDDLSEIVVRPHLPQSRNGHVVRLRPLAIGKAVGRCS